MARDNDNFHLRSGTDIGVKWTSISPRLLFQPSYTLFFRNFFNTGTRINAPLEFNSAVTLPRDIWQFLIQYITLAHSHFLDIELNEKLKVTLSAGELFYWKHKVNKNHESSNGLRETSLEVLWNENQISKKRERTGWWMAISITESGDLSKCLLVILLPISKFPPGRPLQM